MPRQRRNPSLSLDEIHQSVIDVINEGVVASNSTLEDALQAIETIPRPKTIECIKSLGRTLFSAIETAGQDVQSWKLLILTIIRRRYHAKAPEAKKAFLEEKDEDGDRSTGAVTGHGERLSFYLFFVYLQIMARKQNTPQMFLSKACECLARLALPAGGTRDICALVEHLTYDVLNDAGILQVQKDQGNKRALCQAVLTFVVSMSHDGDSKINTPPVLGELLKVIAHLLDDDLAIIKATEKPPSTTSTVSAESPKSAQKTKTLQSTINTFILHHDRGTKARKLVQSIAELMIWSQTSSSRTDSKVSSAFAKLCQSSLLASRSSDTSETTSNDDNIIATVHSLQTSIRRLRQKLNSSSRNQGFSLCSSFLIDPTSITLGMVRCGKEGDVKALMLMASKANNIRITGLISNRFSDPSKAVPITSVRALYNHWISLPPKKQDSLIEEADTKKVDSDNKDDDDKIIKLKLKIQEATVKATIELLRKKIPAQPSAVTNAKSVIASLDDTIDSDGAAILVSAALDSRCTWGVDKENYAKNEESHVSLYIGSELCNVSTLSDVMNLLNDTFTKTRVSNGNFEDKVATTKDVQNLIERNVRSGSQLILFASTDVQLEQVVLQKLQKDMTTVHCHINDDWTRRMDREKAKVGDITFTLAWDNECDLDLHAICPNGDHIFYSKKTGGGTQGGGYLDVDMNAHGESVEPVENIFFGDAEKNIEAAHGKYKVYVQNFAYHGKKVTKGDPVKWRVRVLKDGENTEINGQCVGTGKGSNATVIEFEYSGRKALPPEEIGSALVSSNLVAVTSSVGSTIDSLSELMKLREQHEELNQVRNLVSEVEKEDTKEDNAPVKCEGEEGGTKEDNPVTQEENIAEARPLMADRKAFDVTNRDRLYLNLSTLPTCFFMEVNRSFQGGETLLDHTASQLAKRLIKDNINAIELKRAGYQDDLVDLVKEKMKTFGV